MNQQRRQTSASITTVWRLCKRRLLSAFFMAPVVIVFCILNVLKQEVRIKSLTINAMTITDNRTPALISETIHDEFDSWLLQSFRDNNFTDSYIAYELAKHRLKKRQHEIAADFDRRPQTDPDVNAIDKLITQQQQKLNTDDGFGLADLQQLRHIVQLLSPNISTMPAGTTSTLSTLVQFNVSSKFVLQAVRVPKSGSSTLSMIGRALAGCKPDGYACCVVGCPGVETRPCRVLRACTSHRPTFPRTLSQIPEEPIISQFRHPFDRVLSAFFYIPFHRPSDDCYSLECFRRYVQSETYQNVVTKMLNGRFAYDPKTLHPSNLNIPIKSAKDRLCHQISWFGLVDMPIASQMLLYESKPFSWLRPNPVVFNLPAETIGPSTKKDFPKVNQTKEKFNENTKESYQVSRLQWKKSIELQNLVQSFNQPDYELYDFAVRLFCARVHSAGLLPLSKYFNQNPFQLCQQHYVDTAFGKYNGSQVEKMLCS